MNNIQDSLGKSKQTAVLSQGKIDTGFTGNFSLGVKHDFKKPFSLAAWILSLKKTPGAPFHLGHYKKGGVSMESSRKYSKGGFRFRYASSGAGHIVSTPKINNKKWHHIVFFQNGGSAGDQYGVFIDGKITSKNTIPSTRKEIFSIKLRKFAGRIEDIRFYDFPLDTNQVKKIYNEGKGTLETTLKIGDDEFVPIRHWNAVDPTK
ncbi:MAG: LamG domain-containing protein [Proteobacteria bacterium]|nr:LamG domain-containing protein [Pseudomonadota bacterium]